MSVTLFWRQYPSGNQSAYLLINEGGKQEKIKLDIHIKKGEPIKEKKALAENVRSKYNLKKEATNHGFIPEFKKKTDFIIYFENHLKSYARKDVQKVRNVLVKFKSFSGLQKLPFNQLDMVICEKFMLYLQYDAGLSGGTPYDYWKKFKGVIKQAKKERIISDNPTEEIVFKMSGSSASTALKKNVLTAEEIKALWLTPAHDYTKRTFLFACFTGLGYAEISNLTWKSIMDGKITSYRSKNTRQVINDLHPFALKLIGAPKGQNEKVFPNQISNSKLAKHLKLWVAKAGITKNISFYCGRHTAAVLLAKGGAHIKVIADFMGHSSFQHTWQYLHYVNTMKSDAIFSLSDPSLPDG